MVDEMRDFLLAEATTIVLECDAIALALNRGNQVPVARGRIAGVLQEFPNPS